MRLLARIPSLESLPSNRRQKWRWQNACPTLSPLISIGFQPLLPLLHTFEFPHFNLRAMSTEAMTALIDSSTLFLSVYAAQLRHLDLVVYRHDSSTRMVELVLSCQQLRWLSVSHHPRDAEKAGEEADRRQVADVVALDASVVTAAPLLSVLTRLSVNDVSFSERAMTQLLSKCPKVGEVWMKRPKNSTTPALTPVCRQLETGFDVPVSWC